MVSTWQWSDLPGCSLQPSIATRPSQLMAKKLHKFIKSVFNTRILVAIFGYLTILCFPSVVNQKWLVSVFFRTVSCNEQVAKDGCNGHLCSCLARHFTLGENITLNAGHIRPHIGLNWNFCIGQNLPHVIMCIPRPSSKIMWKLNLARYVPNYHEHTCIHIDYFL